MGYMGISVSYMLWILDTNTKELHENICQLHQLHVLDTSTIKLHENICQLHFWIYMRTSVSILPSTS